MKISHKLILSFLLVASLSSVTIFFTLRSYRGINKTFATLMDDSTRTIEILNGLKQSGEKIVSSTSEIGFISAETTGLATYDIAGEEKQLNESGYQDFETNIKRYDEMVRTIVPNDANTLEFIRASGHDLIETSHDILELKRQNISGIRVLSKRHDFEREEATFLTYINSALKKESAEQIDEQTDVAESIALATREALIVGFLTFMLAIFSGFYISVLISRRIRKLQEATEKVGSGELDTSIEIDSKDEVGDLSRSFNKMIGDLKGSRADLAAREKHFRAMIEKSSDGLALFASDGIVLYASPSTPRVTGYTPDEITGMNGAELIPPEDQAAFGEELGKLVNTPGATVEMVNRIRHKDGSIRWLEGTFTNLLNDPDIGAIVNNYRDVTERKRSESERQVISQIVAGVATTENLDELLHLIHRSIGQILNADNCYVALYDAQTDLINVPFCIDKYDVVAASPVKMGAGLTAYVLRKGQSMLMTPEVICDLTEKGEVVPLGTVPAIWLGVPLKTPKGTIGALVVQHYEDENTYSLRDVEFLSSVGDQIALAIERKTTEVETRRLNLEIDNQRERLNTIITNVQGVVWETKTKIEEGESSLRFDFVSDYIETMLGYSVEECLAKPGFWLDIIHPDDRERTEHVVRAIFASGKGGPVEFRWIARDGHEVWIESRNTIIRDDAGTSIGLRGIAVDITERKSLEEQLTHQALHDPLTKLANRVLFRDRVEHALSRAARKKAPVAVMFLDLDNFKSVNDSLGHAAGDELLVSVTERLKASLRSSDTPARLGGDEFAILVEDMDRADEAIFIAERVRTVLRAPFSICGTDVFISPSIGIATTGDERQTPEELLRNADVAMYMSKSNGKDRYTVFEDKMHDRLIKRVRLEADMRSAIENRQFEVYYQPIMNLHSEKVMGMEALVRWNHPEHGLIPPLDFIPLAEETGLILPLGEWILNEACSQARTWQVEHGLGDGLSITVNIASRQFQEGGLVKTVENALFKSKLPPRSLILEITESTMLLNTEATIKTLNALKTLGVGLAIDDFGTGYSSLSYLQRFPVDILKIDKTFVDRVVSGKEGAAVAKAIITMSETLHLKTIAEGIESLGQQTELQNLGCRLGQGYHFARPLRAADMNEFLYISSSSQGSRRSTFSPTPAKIATDQPVTV